MRGIGVGAWIVAICGFTTAVAFAQAPTSGRGPVSAAPAKRSPAQLVEVKDAPTTPNTKEIEPAKVEPAPPEAAAAIPTDQPADPAHASGEMEKRWLFMGIISPVDMWIPGKYGISATYMSTPYTDYEIEYLRGTFGFSFLGEDLGEAIEQKLSLLTRYFINDHFNYFAGVNYDYLEVNLKNSYTNTVTATSASQDYTYLELATLGVTLGVGSRWQTSAGIDIGVDWLQLEMPLIRLKQYSPFLDLSGDAAKTDEVADAIRRVRDNPRFAALKFQVGISF